MGMGLAGKRALITGSSAGLGRFGRPTEIAAAVTFLCSRYADYISGADLRVDGGVVRTVS